MSQKRVAVITGCSDPDSLGAAFARDLLGRDWMVIATARNVETMKDLKARGCETVALDVTDAKSVAQAAELVKGITEGRLDLLVNNAALAGGAPLLNLNPEMMLEMYSINVVGPIRVFQAFSDQLIATAKTADSPVTILNIGSLVTVGVPWEGSYSSSKAAFQTLSSVMRLELEPFGIRVVTAVLGQLASAGLKKKVLLSYDRPTPHIANYAEIEKRCRDELTERWKSAGQPRDVARDILSACTAAKCPPVIYGGAMAFAIKWVIPMLPAFMLSLMLRKASHLDMVQAV